MASFKVLKPFYKKTFLDPKKREGKSLRETMHWKNEIVSSADISKQYTRDKQRNVIELTGEKAATELERRGVLEFISTNSGAIKEQIKKSVGPFGATSAQPKEVIDDFVQEAMVGTKRKAKPKKKKAK